VLSATVHTLTVAIMAVAVTIVVNWHDSALGWLLGGALGFVAFWLRPRAVRPPAGAEMISRREAPALFAAADRIAEQVGAKPAITIHLHDRLFQCAHLRLGLRREPALVIGLPRLAVLSPRERTAMLGVAFAHGGSGDPALGLLVRSALGTAAEGRRALLGRHIDRYGMPDDPVVGSPARSPRSGWALRSSE
jgi:hypothetical protein